MIRKDLGVGLRITLMLLHSALGLEGLAAAAQGLNVGDG
jgi:hypothetical protein